MAASLPNADSPHLESKEANAPTEEELVPVEWEGPLFDVLLDQSEGMEHRNAGLIELATVTAQNAPAVQRECLRHLVFGLSDEDGALFLNLSTNVVIPVSLRVDFLKEALAIRPPQLGSWLSSQLVNHHEPQISRLARTYLLNVSTPQSPALPAPEQP